MRLLLLRRPILVLAAVVCGPAVWSGAVSAATITVTGTGDTVAVDGLVTLREAMTSVNNGSNVNADVVAVGSYGASDTINFNISGSGVHTIPPASALPDVAKPVTINGYSQPGSSVNTLAVGDNAVLSIEIDGTNAGLGTEAFTVVSAGSGSTFQGLVINRFKQNGSGNGGGAFVVLNASDCTISGNFLGTNSAGTAALANQGAGIFIANASPNNTVGGTTPAARNIIAANGHGGVLLGSPGTTGNVVQGNYIGTNASGTVALPNLGGISITSAASTTIGGTTAAARNVISGNNFVGIAIDNLDAFSNIIWGNFIGTDVTGTLPLPNASGGVLITDGFSGPANNNLIGGTDAGMGNVIAFNSGNGVTIESFQGFENTGNAILRNSIFSNSLLGIDLGGNGVTANDPCDADTGPNNLQNFPVITSVTTGGGSTTIKGTLDSVASKLYRIALFANDACDPSGNGQGQIFLGTTLATTDASCHATFNVTFPVSIATTARVTATATDPNGNTSEFSACAAVQTGFFTVTPCRVADTRNAPGPSGGPALSANTVRTFPVTDLCGISATAKAVAIDLAVFLPSNDGDLRLYPAGTTAPLASAINFRPGIVRANNAIVPVGTGGQISVQCDMPSGSTHFFFDVYGYFE